MASDTNTGVPYDDDDLDSVLLGNSDPPGDGVFDPFATGLEPDEREDGREDSNVDGDVDTAIVYNHPNALYRLGGNGQGGSPDDDGPLPWPGFNSQSTVGEQSARDRQAASTGDRNIRRVADERSASPTTGILRRERTEGVANSILDAQQRIRTNAAIPLNDTERAEVGRRIDHAEEVGQHGTTPRIPRHYHRKGVSTPPAFEDTVFEATIIGLKSNTNGDWIAQFLIPSSDRDAATELSGAYGLALDVAIIRKTFTPGGLPPGTPRP